MPGPSGPGSRAVDQRPATFPPYEVYPLRPEWTPLSGTLSSPRQASREKGLILLETCTAGIVAALRQEFGIPPERAADKPAQ